MPLFLKCSNNEGGKQMRLTYETRQTMNVDLSTIYDTSYLGRIYLGPCQSHIKYIDYYRRIFKYLIYIFLKTFRLIKECDLQLYAGGPLSFSSESQTAETSFEY